MTKIHNIFATLTMLTLFSACQSDTLVDNSLPDSPQTVSKLTVRASMPGEAESRAHIVYGYGTHGTDSEELFRWFMKGDGGITDRESDFITLFNLSKLDECPNGVELEITAVNGQTATFESTSFEPSFRYEAGDTVCAFLGETLRKFNADATYDARNIFTIALGTESNKPQYIEKEPDMETTLAFMSDNLKMYDIAIVETADSIPDLHFKHLSAIFRVTLHNESGHDIYPTKIEVNYPTTSQSAVEGDPVDRNPSFFNTAIYLSVEPDCSLKVYDTDDFFHGSKPYTYDFGTTINGKDGTADAGESIPDGSSYELYLSSVPRIGNDSKGDSISIHLIENHVTANPFVLTLNGFDTLIEAGKRYWFNVTATPDHKLVLTKHYNPDDYKQPSEPTEE